MSFHDDANTARLCRPRVRWTSGQLCDTYLTSGHCLAAWAYVLLRSKVLTRNPINTPTNVKDEECFRVHIPTKNRKQTPTFVCMLWLLCTAMLEPVESSHSVAFSCAERTVILRTLLLFIDTVRTRKPLVCVFTLYCHYEAVTGPDATKHETASHYCCCVLFLVASEEGQRFGTFELLGADVAPMLAYKDRAADFPGQFSRPDTVGCLDVVVDSDTPCAGMQSG